MTVSAISPPIGRLASWTRVFRAGLMVGWYDFLMFWNWKTWLSAWMLRIVTSATAWVLMGQLLGSEEKLRYLLIGNAIAAGPLAAALSIAASTWERMNGTYPLLVIAPSSMLPALMGRTFIWALNGVASSYVAFAILGLAFKVPFPATTIAAIAGIVPLICASSYAFAMVLGALVTRVPRARQILINAMTPSIMAFTGVSVPLAFWPGWVQGIAAFLPVTHGLGALRGVIDGAGIAEIGAGLLTELLVGIGWFALSLLILDRLADAGRADGSIEFA